MFVQLRNPGEILKNQPACMFCDADDFTGGYTYHELYTCKACLDRVGLKTMDDIAHKIGWRHPRTMRLLPESKRRQIFNDAVRKYGIHAR